MKRSTLRIAWSVAWGVIGVIAMLEGKRVSE
jgi:hypothetical protein